MKNKEEEIEFLTISEVSKRFRISKVAIFMKIRRGVLRGVKIGGTWRVYANQFPQKEGGRKENATDN